MCYILLTRAMSEICQGLLNLGSSREERLRRVTLQVDENDIVFALQVGLDSGSFLTTSLCAMELIGFLDVLQAIRFFCNVLN